MRKEYIHLYLCAWERAHRRRRHGLKERKEQEMLAGKVSPLYDKPREKGVIQFTSPHHTHYRTRHKAYVSCVLAVRKGRTKRKKGEIFIGQHIALSRDPDASRHQKEESNLPLFSLRSTW